ncbi:MAG TPA: chromosome segregation protein SMC [Candidatus Gemmiger excrementipullorum]|uniref:Chromosome partition protein Smc n=1 Tax=Candidatus Gemmiger excrementipullorum TaxID=2838610 RepID=A0A9D1Y0U5_9FIRM|nr:chromosome segregation protein SMC [Candidatus Gemmiger excrementipullorum]
MRLKELEIQGFKSFPDRTKLTIGAGITGVVGPNGSGKSNISDAIRWVLGETSSRQLRGSGKMEDVIFGGTQTRGAMGYASVALTIDNTDHGLDVDADEVTIGRRYYRSGESEYSINGQSVRLKDVYELLLNTGLGRDGYAIVSQGRITAIVGAKSSERREIFEEASGIAKYRYRKNEAERRLAAAEANLERLRDILGELERRVGPLKRDSEKAQQFLELSAVRKSLEVTLWVDAIRRANESLRDQQRKYEAAQADYDRLSRQLDDFDAQSAALRERAQAMVLQVEQANADIRALTEANAGSESEAAVLKNESEHERFRIDEAHAELERAGQGRQSIEQESAAHRTAIEALRQNLAELDERLAALRASLQQLEEKAAASGQRRDAVDAAMARLQDAATTAKVRAAAARTAADAAETRRAEAERQAQQAQQNAAAAEADQRAAADALQKAEDAVTRNENIKKGLTLKLESRRRLHEEAADALQKADRERSSTAQRIHILEDLERNLDGYQQSVKTVMRAAANRRLRGIIGPVAGILTVQKGYETAIETALGFALQNIVVEDQGCARAAIGFLKDERAGRATFLPLDTVQGSRFTGRLTGTAEVAADLVQADARYQHIVDNLLGRIIVVEDLAEASAVAKALNYRNRIVTRDGQVVNAGGSFTGGSTARSAGVFSRKQELEELRQKLAKLAARHEAAQKELDARKAEVDNLSAQLAGAEAEGMTAASERLRAGMELDRLAAAAAQYAENVHTLAAEAEAQAQARAAAEEEAAVAEAEAAAAEAERARCAAELAELGESAGSLSAEREAITNELAETQMQRLAGEKDIGLHEAALQGLQSRTGETEARERELRATVEAARARIEANEQKIAALERTRGENQQKIAAAEQTIRMANAARLQAEADTAKLAQENRALTGERERMSGEMARLAERRNALESELNDTNTKLWEEYQLTDSEARALCVPFDSLTELRRQVAETRGKIRALGNVNVGAIDEYKEVKERYDFLKAQVTDVEKARAELTRMIAELCSEMEELFAASFKEINRHFGQIFRELFGGGHARLYLSDPENVLDSGIEIEVSPPGKVIKNLSALSGGEQSLVAISIYFAILNVNPAPFCILDEIEAALDDVNVNRYAQYLHRMTANTQFIVITHRRGTMEAADVLYGVTMQEDGVSKILRLDLDSVTADLIS